ncbi:MAG: hypothetical protein LBQ47_07155 [Endomicrobium sp.]|nr:hypothetical protein [Endomicrobium sp.]
MLQTIAVIAIVALAAALFIRHITKGCGCSCGVKKDGKNSCCSGSKPKE